MNGLKEHLDLPIEERFYRFFIYWGVGCLLLSPFNFSKMVFPAIFPDETAGAFKLDPGELETAVPS